MRDMGRGEFCLLILSRNQNLVARDRKGLPEPSTACKSELIPASVPVITTNHSSHSLPNLRQEIAAEIEIRLFTEYEVFGIALIVQRIKISNA